MKKDICVPKIDQEIQISVHQHMVRERVKTLVGYLSNHCTPRECSVWLFSILDTITDPMCYLKGHRISEQDIRAEVRTISDNDQNLYCPDRNVVYFVALFSEYLGDFDAQILIQESANKHKDIGRMYQVITKAIHRQMFHSPYGVKDWEREGIRLFAHHVTDLAEVARQAKNYFLAKSLVGSVHRLGFDDELNDPKYTPTIGVFQEEHCYARDLEARCERALAPPFRDFDEALDWVYRPIGDVLRLRIARGAKPNDIDTLIREVQVFRKSPDADGRFLSLPNLSFRLENLYQDLLSLEK